MRISDWSSDVCSSDLLAVGNPPAWGVVPAGLSRQGGHRPDWSFWPRQKRLSEARRLLGEAGYGADRPLRFEIRFNSDSDHRRVALALLDNWRDLPVRSEEHTSELQSLMRNSYAVFCLKKKQQQNQL